MGKINRTQLIRRALGATAAAALMVVGLVGTAQAQTATTNAAATFAAQARAAGLTTAQASGLQAEVNTYLAQLGGRQVAANAIDLNGTGGLVLPVPGELKVRPMAGSAATMPEINGTCFLGDFCTWQLFDGNGGFLFKFACNSPVNFPSSWITGHQGSFWNHQTGGAFGYVYAGLNGTGKNNLKTPPGSLSNRPWGLTPIDRSFIACK